MGELIRREAASAPLPFSGERLTAVMAGRQVEIEHYHRYLLARDFCRDRDVLDLASGEGYGTALIAQVARSVVGVEIDAGVVVAARAEFARANLRYEQGDARAIPLPNASVDVVVSFETVEHILEQDVFLGEVRRVLRPGGLLVISTPDRDVYSPVGVPPNQHHVLELTRAEFETLLLRHFAHASFAAQRAVIGSLIVRTAPENAARVFELRGATHIEANDDMPRAPYLIALASDNTLPPLPWSAYVHRSDLDSEFFVRRQLEERLQAVESETAASVAEASARAERAEVEAAEATAALERGRAEILSAGQAEARAVGRAERAEAYAADMIARADRAEAHAADMIARADRAEAYAADMIARADRAVVAATESEALADRVAASLKAAEMVHAHTATARAEAESRMELADHRASQLQAELAGVIAERDALLQSTTWKATWPIRWAGGYLAPGQRRALRAAAKLGWWSLTLKLRRKLRERQTALTLLRAPTEAPCELQSDPATPDASPVLEAALVETVAAAVTRPAGGGEAPAVLYVSGEPDTPGHVYRVARPIAAIGSSAGWIRVDEIPTRIHEIEAAKALVIWRAEWSGNVAMAVDAGRRAGAKIVFDIDDLMFEPELARIDVIDGIRTQNLDERAVRDFFERVRWTMGAADLCIASTEELAGYLRRAQMPTIVLPNGVDREVIAASRLAVRRRRIAGTEDGLVRIGYAAGTRTHQRDFAVCSDAVGAVLRARPECRLVVFRFADGSFPCLDVDEFPALRGLEGQIEWRNYVPLEQLPNEKARFDINLAPLEVGNPFCESKSELKLFEAALVDVPTVASPTGPFRRAIRHGETGFLADTPAEWECVLLRLVEDVPLRRRVATAARREALWLFGPERRAEMLDSLLDLLEGGRRAAHAFALDISRGDDRPIQPKLGEYEIVFEVDHLGTAEVTVVVPLYNYAAHIEEALASVLAQTLSALDLIVVDDCSTDDSLRLAQNWIQTNAGRFNRALLVRNQVNSGLGRTRNVGFDLADTPYVLPLDADNRLLPNCAARCLYTAKKTGAAIAYPVIRTFGSREGLMGERPFDPVRLRQGNYIDAMALIAKAAWILVGGYDLRHGGWEDFGFLCRLMERGLRGERVPGEPLAEYREHPTSMIHAAMSDPRMIRRMMNELTDEHKWLRLVWPSPEPEPRAEDCH